MARMTTYLKNKVYSHILQGAASTSPGTVYLALFTSATTDDGAGTEISGGGYARQPVDFGDPLNGFGGNESALLFPDLPAAAITHAALMDAASGGNMLLHGPLQAVKVVSAGDDLPIEAGDVTATFG